MPTGSRFAQRKGDVVSGEARSPLRQPIGSQQFPDHVLAYGRDPRRRHSATSQAVDVRGMPAEFTGLSAPTLAQLARFAGAPFCPARGERRQLGRARSADTALFERGDDLGPPATEQPPHFGRDVRELGDAVTHWLPLDADRPHELAPQHRLMIRLAAEACRYRRRPSSAVQRPSAQ
jgi:hypothetical protein